MKLFYSDTYASTDYSFDTTRKSKWIADSLVASPVAGVRLVEPESLAAATVAETHSLEYVEAIRTGEPWSVASSHGFRWCEGLFPAVLASNGGLVAAVKAAMEDGISGTLSSGMHHARRDAGLGFCTFNGLAIAAKEALKAGVESVLILDLDAHGGGGTQSLISGNVRIQHLDIAVDQFDLHEATIDLSGRSPLDYLTALDFALRDLRPGLVIYNAGMDVAESDCGPTGFNVNIIAAREVMVFEWAFNNRIPIAFALAGGYVSRDRTREELVAHHRCTIRAASHFFSQRKELAACQM